MRASLCHLLIYPHPSPPHLSFPPRPPTRVYTLSLHAALPISRFDRFEMVPFATQRAPSCRATATAQALPHGSPPDQKSTRLNSSHGYISYAVFCLKKKNTLFTSVSCQSGRTIYCPLDARRSYL